MRPGLQKDRGGPFQRRGAEVLLAVRMSGLDRTASRLNVNGDIRGRDIMERPGRKTAQNAERTSGIMSSAGSRLPGGHMRPPSRRQSIKNEVLPVPSMTRKKRHEEAL
jgi:hypothetical protein